MSLMITQIRQMLKSSLAEWEAGDTSAFIMIEPWKDVWSGAEWDQFVMQAVVPKLAFYLKNLSVPTDSVSSKTLEPIQNWVNHVPIGAINRMLIDFFFPEYARHRTRMGQISNGKNVHSLIIVRNF
jgi:hypothetical protein